MAVIFCRHFFHPLSLTYSSSSLSLKRSTLRMSASSSDSMSSSMDSQSEGRRKFMEFPFVSTSHKNLMVDVVSTVEHRLESQLLPCTLPPDVQFFQNQSGSAQASLHIRSGQQTSYIDFILGSWLHCELPTGGALNITSLSTYLKSSTDAPNFLFEIIQSSPTSLILVLDLPPRQDLVLNPDYLKIFYEDTQLDAKRQTLEKIPEVIPYIPSSLYLRSAISPTAVMARIETQTGGPEQLEEIVKNQVHQIAKEVVGIWLDQCAFGVRDVGDQSERGSLEKRDGIFKSKTIEIDLGSSLPRLFGAEAADRVLEAIRKVFVV